MATGGDLVLLCRKAAPDVCRRKMPLINIKMPATYYYYLITGNVLSLPFFKK
jgi:hypothetical protein